MAHASSQSELFSGSRVSPAKSYRSNPNPNPNPLHIGTLKPAHHLTLISLLYLLYQPWQEPILLLIPTI